MNHDKVGEEKRKTWNEKEQKPKLLNMLYRLRKKKWQYVHLIQLNVTITIGSYN